MENALIEFAKAVPELAVLVWIVRSFLIHLSTRDALLKEIGSECHGAIDKNTAALAKNSEILRGFDRKDK